MQQLYDFWYMIKLNYLAKYFWIWLINSLTEMAFFHFGANLDNSNFEKLLFFHHFSFDLVYTANIYSQFTVIDCVTCATVFFQWLLQATTILMTFNDTEMYSLRSLTILECNVCIQVTVAHVTLPKAILSAVKIFTM